MNFKGAVFDLDGTLLDSMEVWKNIDIEFLSKRGLQVPKDYSDEILAMSFRETAEYTIARFGLREQPDDVMHEWNQMAIEAYGHHVQLKPGAKEYLLKLKSRGIRLGVCTALSQKLYLPCLQNNGIYELFDACISTDDVSRGKIILMLGYYVQHVWAFLLKTVWRLRMFFLQYKGQKQHI